MEAQHFVVNGGSTMGEVGAAAPAISDAVRWGDVVYLSGRAAVNPATLELVAPDFEQQARAVLRDVGEVLQECGSSWARVIRIEAFLADGADFAAWNRIWTEHFAPPRPARTTVVCGFGVQGILIELQVTAGVGMAS